MPGSLEENQERVILAGYQGLEKPRRTSVVENPAPNVTILIVVLSNPALTFRRAKGLWMRFPATTCGTSPTDRRKPILELGRTVLFACCSVTNLSDQRGFTLRRS